MTSLYGVEAVRRLVTEWEGRKVVCILGERVDEEALIAQLRILMRNKGLLINPTNAAITKTIKKKPHVLSLYTADFVMTSALQNIIQSQRSAIVVKSANNTLISSKDMIFWTREDQDLCFNLCQVANKFRRSFTKDELRRLLPMQEDREFALGWGLIQTNRGRLTLNEEIASIMRQWKEEELNALKEEELNALASQATSAASSGIKSSSFYVRKQECPLKLLRFNVKPVKRTRKRPTGMEKAAVDFRLRGFRQLKESYLVTWKQQRAKDFLESLHPSVSSHLAMAKPPENKEIWSRMVHRVLQREESSGQGLSLSGGTEFFSPVVASTVRFNNGQLALTSDELEDLEENEQRAARYFKRGPIQLVTKDMGTLDDVPLAILRTFWRKPAPIRVPEVKPDPAPSNSSFYGHQPMTPQERIVAKTALGAPTKHRPDGPSSTMNRMQARRLEMDES